MSTATPPAPTTLVRNGIRLLTAADVYALPRTLPSGDVRFELRNGILLTLPPLTYQQSRCVSQLIAELHIRGEQRGHGVGFGRVGVLLRQNPDYLIAPPTAFLTTAQLPACTSPEDYLLTPPALVIEVRSKNDSQPEIDAKVQEYLAAGVVLVWVADPELRTITAYRASQPPTVFAASDTLTADPVIPGFAVPIANLLPAS